MMRIPILLYHQIAPLPKRDIPYSGLLVHPDRFRSQMYWLKRLGYQGLSLRDALPYIKGAKTGKVIAITFDDGFLNVLENAAPVLAECGFTATNYFVGNQLGGSNVWDQPLGVPPTPLMSAAQLRQWAALGHEVGAHTLDHVHLNKTADDEAKRQISDSRTVLQDVLGADVSSFCFPYGENSPIHRQMAKEAGFENATTTVRARATATDDPFGLPRISIRRRDIWPKFLRRLSSR